MIGLDDIVIEDNDIISHEKIGSLSGIFGCLEVEIILILVNNLKLRQSCVQPQKYISKITGGISRLHKNIEVGFHVTRGMNSFTLFQGIVSIEPVLDCLSIGVEQLAPHYHGISG